jgi:hypothetical protein
MASNGNSKGGLLTAGGILSIIGGALEVVGGGIMVGTVIAHRELFRLPSTSTSGHPSIYFGPFGNIELTWLIIAGVAILVLGVIAIVGGVSAIRKKSFGLSFAGAICALPSVIAADALPELVLFQSLVMAIPGTALVILGIMAVIFVALGRKGFKAKA